jgi:hypothetical protein
VFWLITSLAISYFIGLVLVIYADLDVRLDLLKFIIPMIILSFSVTKVLIYEYSFSSKEKISFLFICLFGFFNGLGSSINIDQLYSRLEIGLISILEVVIGFGASVSILFLLIIGVNLLLRKIVPLTKIKWVIGISVVVFCVSLPLLLKQVFY